MNNLFEPEPVDADISLKRKVLNALGKIKALYLKIPLTPRIILSIIVVTFLLIYVLILTKPEPDKRPAPETTVSVETIPATVGNYPVVVAANGTVDADTRGNLVAQIRGEIVNVANNFKAGGRFKKGDVLITIDDRDYHAEVSRTLANLSSADAVYRQEQANAKQATKDWSRLGNTGPAPDLVLRKPQLAAANAARDSAQAVYESAKLNLERTRITAPYDGRVIQRNAVLGQYVSVGTPLAEIYASDAIEVRLPVSQSEYSQLGLDNADLSNETFPVILTSKIGNNKYQWQATITRTDSVFDLNTRQIDVIATLNKDESNTSQKPSLKIGQFVNAQLQGRTIENVVIVPNKAIREGHYAYLVKDSKLVRSPVTILWQDNMYTLIESGIEKDDAIVITALGSNLAGAIAKVSNSLPENTSPVSAPETEAPLAPKEAVTN